MKSFARVGAACLTALLLVAANASGQSLPAHSPSTLNYYSAPAYSASGYIAPGYGNPAYYTLPSAAAAPQAYAPPQGYSPQGYSAMPSYPGVQAAGAGAYPTANSYPAAQGYAAAAYRRPGAQPVLQTSQPNPYTQANYAAQPAWHYPPAQTMYRPASSGETSVMLHNNNLHGGPPLTAPQQQLQPQPQAGAYGPAPNMGYGPTPAYGYEPAPAYGYQSGPGYGYAPMPGQLWTDAYAAGYSASCVSPAPARAQNWFAAASGLIMTRDHGNRHTFSYGTLAEEVQRTDVRDAAMDWSGGFDVRFGRYFNCGRNAVEAVYWGLSPASGSTQTVSADVLGDLSAILNFSDLDYGGVTADNFTNVLPGDNGIHRVQREFEFHNVEVNVWQFCTTCGGNACSCSRFRFNWLAGVRYFRFNEYLSFGAHPWDTQLTFSPDEIYYNIDVENNLVGFQLGNELEYCLSSKWTLDVGIKLGLYGNNIRHVSEIGGAQGVATINNGPFAGDDFYIRSSKKDVAFLGEARAGLEYCINPCWTATIGYRAFAVTGVALPSEQIYPDLRGINDVVNIDSNGSLILHGGYAGLEYCW